MELLNYYSDIFQGLGSILAVAISLTFSVITMHQSRSQLRASDEELQLNKRQQERESARQISAWYAKDIKQADPGLECLVVSNNSYAPIYNIEIVQSGGGAPKNLQILPPGLWFFRKNHASKLYTQKWGNPVQLVSDSASPSGYACQMAPNEHSLLQFSSDSTNSEITIRFRDNNNKIWENCNGELKQS